MRVGCRGLTSCDACSHTKATAVCTEGVTGSVRITHPFHPHHGIEIDFVSHQRRWDEDRVFYRDSHGHLASLPARWTSVIPEDPFVTMAAGRTPFRVDDLIDLVALIARLRS